MGKVWVYCPKCQKKTRVQIRIDTILRNFPLYCPKCKSTTLIDASGKQVFVVNSDSCKI